MKKIMMALIATFAFASFAQANDTTVGEKIDHSMDKASDNIKAGGRKAKRMAKKAGHRVEEATCMEGDLTCAGKKMKNRAVEGKDATVDGVKGVKDKVTN